MIIEKKFHIFTHPWKKVKIYVSTNKIFKHKLLKVLAYKTLPVWYYKIRTFFLFRFIINLFFTVKKEVPDEGVFLIYEGYESTLYFYKEKGKTSILRLEDGTFTKEDFLGYPIHWDFTKREVPHKSAIEEVLKEHWSQLKSGEKTLHGDFTHSNILIDDEGAITIIDSQEVRPETPIIYDLFYFYSYFLYRASISNNEDFYEKQLEQIYLNIFKDEKEVIESVEYLDNKYFHFTNDVDVFKKYKRKFKKFLEQILQ
jgi:hypothetical protein